MNMKEMAEAIGSLQTRLDKHEVTLKMYEERFEEIEANNVGRKRGPKTERAMTDADAWMVKFGPLKKPVGHKEAAEKLGLSYGQVFSCRGSYTFKGVKADAFKPEQFAENFRLKEQPK